MRQACCVQAIEDVGTNISYGTLLHQMHRSLKNLKQGSTSNESHVAKPGSGRLSRLTSGGSGRLSRLASEGSGRLSGLLKSGSGRLSKYMNGGCSGGYRDRFMCASKILLSKPTGPDGLAGILQNLVEQSNTKEWDKQTPVLSSNEARITPLHTSDWPVRCSLLNTNHKPCHSQCYAHSHLSRVRCKFITMH